MTKVPFGAIAMKCGEARVQSGRYDVAILRRHPEEALDLLRPLEMRLHDLLRQVRVYQPQLADMFQARLRFLQRGDRRRKKRGLVDGIGQLSKRRCSGPLRGRTSPTSRNPSMRSSTMESIFKAQLAQTIENAMSYLEAAQSNIRRYQNLFQYRRDLAVIGHLTESLISRKRLRKILRKLGIVVDMNYLYMHATVSVLQLDNDILGFHFTIPIFDGESYTAWPPFYRAIHSGGTPAHNNARAVPYRGRVDHFSLQISTFYLCHALIPIYIDVLLVFMAPFYGTLYQMTYVLKLKLPFLNVS
ncbi:hypothetical protein CAPTEDRAFT_200103 [Capitella teleta]|uniref:Uncharacterized protein n=1 Tax=Capitella teleta TaxID=283909 RepID=R7URH0_CAPTE|nr:hypothetical protein CAPTEDRAFT_200103 [Capitella teleta]|eukprot:ELU09099.1 hypothetical protein CAPTEDRAFT_200103 [Capitella teleta]